MCSLLLLLLQQWLASLQRQQQQQQQRRCADCDCAKKNAMQQFSSSFSHMDSLFLLCSILLITFRPLFIFSFLFILFVPFSYFLSVFIHSIYDFSHPTSFSFCSKYDRCLSFYFSSLLCLDYLFHFQPTTFF